MTYTGKIFDCDSHLYEKPDAWLRYLPGELREEWGTEFRYDESGEFALHVGKRKVAFTDGYMTPDFSVPRPGSLKDWLKAVKRGEPFDLFVPMADDMIGREARLAKMDEFGVEACILFMGWHVSTLAYYDDPRTAQAILHAYNRYLEEEWGFGRDNRIYTAPAISLADLDSAVAETEWLIERGVRIVVMQMGPIDGRSPGDPYFDPVWTRLNEAGVNLAYHIGEAPHMHPMMRQWGFQPMETRQKQSAWVWMNAYGEMPVVQTLSSLIFDNFFARFPNIKVLSAENGSDWVPYMLERMDKARGLARNGFWRCGQLKERPSEIFRRNVAVVAYPEDSLRQTVAECNSAEFLVMGSDYPHPEGVTAPRAFADEACTGLDQAQTKAIMYDNGRRLIPVR
jgi:predicted TIM-barrel fold metal-dependent hydrolase